MTVAVSRPFPFYIKSGFCFSACQNYNARAVVVGVLVVYLLVANVPRAVGRLFPFYI